MYRLFRAKSWRRSTTGRHVRCSFDGCEELRWGDLEPVSELDDDIKSRVAASAFQTADVCAVEPDMMGEGLLRRPSVLPAQISKTHAEGDAVRQFPHTSTISLR